MRRIRLGVSKDSDFARSGNQIECNISVHLALGCRDIGPARTDDLLHLGNRTRPIGQHADRVNATDTVDLRRAGQVNGVEHIGIDHAISPAWGACHDFGDPGHFRYRSRHQRRRCQRRLAGRHVDPHPVEGRKRLTKHAALGARHLPVLLDPGLGKRRDPPPRLARGLPECRVNRFARSRDLTRRHAHIPRS